MIPEENDEYANWFAYENVSASRGRKKKGKRGKGRPKGKSPEHNNGENGSSTVPIIARPESLDANVAQWSYLPHTSSS